MILALCIIWTTVFLMMYYAKNRKYFIMGDKIPGPPAWPIIGNANYFLNGKPSRIMKMIYRCSRDYKRVARLWLGTHLIVLVFDPREAEVVLRSKDTEKSNLYIYLHDWLGDSILLSKGDKFRKHKKLIMPNFHTHNLKDVLPIFHQQSKKLVNDLQDELDKDEFDIGEYLNTYTLSILLETTLGINKDTLGKEKMVDYAEAVENLTKCSFIRLITLKYHSDLIFNQSKRKKVQDESLDVVTPIIKQIIETRKKEIEVKKDQMTETGENVKTAMCFVDRLLLARGDDGYQLNDTEVKDEVSTIMFGGHDTTTISAGFALSLLACYQDCQDKVMAEIDEIFGQDTKRPATYEDLSQMKYLEQVINETLRLYPPIPVIGKKAMKDIPLENCVIPAGATIGIPFGFLNRNPDYFPNPDEFNPDNFLPERVAARHPYAFIPFSSGTRTCIGRKYAMLLLKMILSNILRTYRVYSKVQHKEFKVVAHTVLRRKDGFRIYLKKKSVDSNNARG